MLQTAGRMDDCAGTAFFLEVRNFRTCDHGLGLICENGSTLSRNPSQVIPSGRPSQSVLRSFYLRDQASIRPELILRPVCPKPLEKSAIKTEKWCDWLRWSCALQTIRHVVEAHI